MTENVNSHKVFIVDDHALFRGGLRGLLEKSGNGICSVVGEASDGQEFLDKITDCDAEVVLLDIDMPLMNGIEAAARVLDILPDLKIITLSMHGEQEYYFKMVSIGVKGFLLKNSEIGEVISAIETVARGGSYFSQELLQDLVGNLKTSPKQDDSGEILSEREQEILFLICKGMSNQEIADKLFISKRTVDKHRANIMEKTGSKNTANLVVYAIKHSLVEI